MEGSRQWVIVDCGTYYRWDGLRKTRLRKSGGCQITVGGKANCPGQITHGRLTTGEPVQFVLARMRGIQAEPPRVFPLPHPLRLETLEEDLKAYAPKNRTREEWAKCFGWYVEGLPWDRQPCRSAVFRFMEVIGAPLAVWRRGKLDALLPLVSFIVDPCFE